MNFITEVTTRGTATNQTALWILLIVFSILTVWVLVDIVIWCIRWAKGEDDETSDFNGANDGGDDDGSHAGSRAG